MDTKTKGEGYKKWICEKAGVEQEKELPRISFKSGNATGYTKDTVKVIYAITLETLIKAMWSVNREGKYTLHMTEECVGIGLNGKWGYSEGRYDFIYHNNSEQEALEAALKYIYDNKGK